MHDAFSRSYIVHAFLCGPFYEDIYYLPISRIVGCYHMVFVPVEVESCCKAFNFAFITI